MKSARRICPDCHRRLTGEDFHANQSVCKRCNYARVKAWRAANPEKWHEQDRRRKADKRRRAKAEKGTPLMKTEVIEPAEKGTVDDAETQSEAQ